MFFVFSCDKFEYKLSSKSSSFPHMLLIDVFRIILYHFTFFFCREKKNDIHAMKFIFSTIFSRFLFECLGRQNKTYIEMGVSYNLILRYIILRIWAWKFHSIVENLIWYFFSIVVFHFPTKKRKKEKKTYREKRRKTRSRESFSTRRWDLVGNCISISFVLFKRFIFICSGKWWTFCALKIVSFRAISFHRISFHFS